MPAGPKEWRPRSGHTKRQKEAVALIKRATRVLHEAFPGWFDAGSSDGVERLAEYVRRKGIPAKVVYGTVRGGKSGDPFYHAWLDILRFRFDPVLWINGADTTDFTYNAAPAVEGIVTHDNSFAIMRDVADLDQMIDYFED